MKSTWKKLNFNNPTDSSWSSAVILEEKQLLSYDLQLGDRSYTTAKNHDTTSSFLAEFAAMVKE